MLRRLALAFVGLLALAGAASAEPIDEAMVGFASSRFDDVEAAIAALAASGSPRAVPTLEALAAGRLLVRRGDRRAWIETTGGGLESAATGDPAPPELAAALKPVRVNNRLRRAVAAALGELTLLSPDPGRRMAAANAVFRSRDPTALSTLDRALADEAHDEVRAALELARAAVVLSRAETPEAERLAAVTILEGSGDQAALAALGALPAVAPAAVRAAAAEALASIQQRQRLMAVAQDVTYGISLGSVLLLAAIGLAITFGVMGVINMAHGEMVMIGAYTTFVIQELCRARYPAGLEWSLLAALPSAFLVAGALGALIERGTIRALYGRPLETLLATWGVSLVLQQLVRSLFGPNNRQVSAPCWMSGSLELGAGLTVTNSRLAIILFGLVVFAALLAVIRLSRFGLEMRAVTQNRGMAAAMGIRTSWIDAMTFGLGSGIAGIAGVALSQIDNVSPNLGQSYIIDSFMVVVFGGVGNLWGTLTGALTLGIVNKLLEPTVGAVLAKILVLVAIILFIQKRPRGLFALRGRAVET